MKTLLLLFLVLIVYQVGAQQLKPLPVPKLIKPQSYTPLGTYRLEEKSSVVYAEVDNMPILLVENTTTMPNIPLKLSRDSVSVHRLQNPLRRHLKALPKK